MSVPAGPRSGRDPESASFDLARVGRGGRGWQPAVIVSFIVVLAGVVTVAVGGRGPAPTAAPFPVAAASAITGATMAPSPTMSQPTSPKVPLASPPTVANDEGPIRLQATRFDASTFVHGDVFVPNVTWVFVSLQDEAGRIAGWASVSVPGAAGPARAGGPSLRFDVELAVPDSSAGMPMSLTANAYDAGGGLMASVQLGVPATR